MTGPMKALVSGSAHLDILARPFSDSTHRDRIGRVSLEAGGTACNLAFNLRKLGQGVRLLTAWGSSPIERLMASHIQSTGVELMADEVEGMPLAAFAALLTVDGDMQSAVSATPVDGHRFSDKRIAEAIAGVDYVIVEANLSSEMIFAIAQQGVFVPFVQFLAVIARRAPSRKASRAATFPRNTNSPSR